MLLRYITAFVFCLNVFANDASAVYLPLDSRSYEDLDALAVRGYLVVPAVTIRPYSRRSIAEGLASLAGRRDELSRYEREIFVRLLTEFADELPDSVVSSFGIPTSNWWLNADINPRVLGQNQAGRMDQPRAYQLPATRRLLNDRLRAINTLDLTFRLTDNLSTFQRLEMDTDGLWDNDFRGHRVYGNDWSMFNATGQAEEAYITHDSRWGTVGAGRMARQWGPERQSSVFLSDNAPAMDMLTAEVHLSWLHFSWLTAELEPELDASTTPISRYFAGHRLVLTPFRWIELGLAEALVYGGTNQGFSLRWSNPFVFLYGEEVNISPTNENLMLSADITLRPVRKTELYGSFVVDDMSIDKPKLAPDRIAWAAGARWEAPLGIDRLGVGVEYARLSRWVYSYARMATWRHYVNKNAVLGHYLGPDGDALFINSRWQAPNGVSVKGLFTHRRQGETRFTTTPPNYYPSEFGYSCEPFPYGIVEETSSAEAIMNLPPFHGAYLSGALMGSSTLNKGNKKAPRRWGWGLRFDLDWHIPVRR